MSSFPYLGGKEYTRIIAIAERSAGNEVVGDMWLDTKSFDKDVSIKEVVAWVIKSNCSGKLIITIDESSIENNDETPF